MIKQTQQYIEEMKRMYDVLIKKESLSSIELCFLEIYRKTIEGVA